MSRFIDFVGPGLADARWLEELSALSRRTSPAWSRLAPEERARLAEALRARPEDPGLRQQRVGS